MPLFSKTSASGRYDMNQRLHPSRLHARTAGKGFRRVPPANARLHRDQFSSLFFAPGTSRPGEKTERPDQPGRILQGTPVEEITGTFLSQSIGHINLKFMNSRFQFYGEMIRRTNPDSLISAVHSQFGRFMNFPQIQYAGDSSVGNLEPPLITDRAGKPGQPPGERQISGFPRGGKKSEYGILLRGRNGNPPGFRKRQFAIQRNRTGETDAFRSLNSPEKQAGLRRGKTQRKFHSGGGLLPLSRCGIQ